MDENERVPRSILEEGIAAFVYLGNLLEAETIRLVCDF